MKYTIIYMHNSRKPTATFTCEVTAENHSDALFKFINMHGTDDAFVCATVRETGPWGLPIVMNTGPQCHPSSVLGLTKRQVNKLLKETRS